MNSSNWQAHDTCLSASKNAATRYADEVHDSTKSRQQSRPQSGAAKFAVQSAQTPNCSQ